MGKVGGISMAPSAPTSPGVQSPGSPLNLQKQVDLPEDASQVERDVGQIVQQMGDVSAKSRRQRRKSTEIQAEAAEVVQRLSALMAMGSVAKVTRQLSNSKARCSPRKLSPP